MAPDDYRDICKHNHQAEQTSTLNGKCCERQSVKQAALVARAFAISADYKVRVGCGALDIAGTRRTSACRRSDCTVAETGRKRRSKRPDKARLACAHKPAIARHFQDWARSSRRPPTDRGWERGAPARSLYLG